MSKRTAVSAFPAAAAPSAATASDRNVRQRQGSAPLIPSSAAGEAATAPALRPSFLRLAVVERQLIMQCLGLRELDALASSCKQMSGEAKHKEAGCKSLPPLVIGRKTAAGSWDNISMLSRSVLIRTHAVIELRIDDSDSSTTVRFAHIDRALNFADEISRQQPPLRVRDCVFLGTWDQPFFTAQTWSMLLHRPFMQTVSSLRCLYWAAQLLLTSAALQAAVFALPALTEILLGTRCISFTAEHPLLENAIKGTKHLIRADFDTKAIASVRALVHATALQTLRLNFNFGGQAESVSPTALGSCLPSSLTSLTVSSLNYKDLPPLQLAIAEFRDLFIRVPLLRTLCVEDCCGNTLLPLLYGLAGPKPLESVATRAYAVTVNIGQLQACLEQILPTDPGSRLKVQLRLYGVSDRLRSEFAVFQTQAWIDRGFTIVLEDGRRVQTARRSVNEPGPRRLEDLLAAENEEQ